MKKRLISFLLLIILLLSLTACKSTKEEPPKSEEKSEEKINIEENILNSTVNIYTVPENFGAGFAIEGGYIVTNNHVITNHYDIVTVVTYNKEKYHATLIGADEKNDIAVLKIDKELKPLTLADSNQVKEGDEVTAIGNPNGDLSFSKAPGKIISVPEELLNIFDKQKRFIYYDGNSISGYSGGPVYNNKTGEIIGILNNRYVGDLSKYEYENLCGIIPMNRAKESINEILKEVNRNEE